MLLRRFFVISEQFLFSLTNFVLSFVLARFLSKYEFGLWAFISLLFNLNITVLSAIVFQPMMVRLSNHHRSIGYTALFMIITVFVSLVLMFIDAFVFIIKMSVNGFLLLWILFYILSNSLFEFIRRVEMARFGYGYLLSFTFLRTLSLIVILLASFYTRLNLVSVVLLWSATLMVVNIVWWFVRGGRAQWRLSFLRVKFLFLSLWQKFGKWLLGRSLFQFFSNQLYMILVAFVKGPVPLGEFQIIRLLFTPLVVFSQGVHNLFLPILARYMKNDSEKAKRTFRWLFWGFIGFCVFYLLIVLGCGRYIALVFLQGKYGVQQYIENIILFSGAPFGSAMIFIVVAGLLAVDKAVYIFNVAKRVFFLNLCIAPFLVLKFGLKGALIGNSLVQLIAFVLYLFYLKKLKLL